MAWGAKKPEHAGAKKGTAAFHDRKVDAKHASSRRRRQSKKATINIELKDDRERIREDRELNAVSILT